MPTVDLSRRRFEIIGHIIDSEERVVHTMRYTPSEVDADSDRTPPPDIVTSIITTEAELIPDHTIIEIHSTWTVIPIV